MPEILETKKKVSSFVRWASWDNYRTALDPYQPLRAPSVELALDRVPEEAWK